MTPEEALLHATRGEISRLPPSAQKQFVGRESQMTADHMAGKTNRGMMKLMQLGAIGDPDRQPKTPGQAFLREGSLKDYPGRAWLPDQVEQFKRENQGKLPGSYDMSPGGKMLDGIHERQRLLQDMGSIANGGVAQPQRHGWFFDTSPGAWVGEANIRPDIEQKIAADNYTNSLDRKKAGAWSSIGDALFNPGNWLGNAVTKTLGVGPDVGSQLATARNTGTNQNEVLGDVAARRDGADWNLTYPQIAASQGSGLDNDALIKRMRQAYMDSQGQSAGDTFRSWQGHNLPESWNGKVPYIQPGINSVMGFANGLLDGSTLLTGGVSGLVKAGAMRTAKAGLPLVSKYASGVVDDIARNGTLYRTMQEVGDEALDPTQAASTVAEFVNPDEDETASQFADRTQRQAVGRKQALRDLEQGQNLLRTPKTTFQQVTAPVTRSVGGFLGNLLY